MMYSLLLVLLAVASIPSTLGYAPVIEEVVHQGARALREVNYRYKRDLSNGIDDDDEFEWFMKSKDTFCFCGKQNWILNIVKENFTETKVCITEGLKNFSRGPSTDKEKPFMNLETIVKASVCVYDCIFKELDLVSSEGTLDKNKTTDFFINHVFKEDGIKEVSKKVVDKCLTTGTDNTLSSDLLLNMGRGECNQESYKFVTCLLFEIITECPTNLKRYDEPHCAEIYRNLNFVRLLSKKD